MSDWKSLLRADPTAWLLEKDNPSVRYFTLTDILERPRDTPEVMEARLSIMESSIVSRILAKQNDGGYWGRPEDFYVRAKYRGTVWQLIILAELGVNGLDTRVRQACEFILRNSQDRQSGGFSTHGSETGGGSHSGVIPCLTGNMAWTLLRFGYLEDPRLHKAIDWITGYRRFDDGTQEIPSGWPYAGKHQCWGRHTCHMGVVKTLKALAEIPENHRSSDVRNAIDQGAEYLLAHHLHKRSHDLTQVARQEWLQFGFPLLWKTDALDMLLVLTRLGYHDKRMRDAIDLVISKQDSQARWNLETTFNGRMLVNIEQKGKPGRWVTLNALRVLKRVGE